MYFLFVPTFLINKEKEKAKGDVRDSYRGTEAKQKLLQNVMSNEVDTKKKEMALEIQSARKDLQRNSKQQ